MWLILSFLETTKVFLKIIILSVDTHLALWDFSTTLIFNKWLKLLYPEILEFHALFCVSIYSIICFQLFLELDDRFVSLIESWCQCNHDISLFQEELLVSINLLFIFLDLDSFLLNFLHPLIIFLSDHFLSFFECISKLWSIFNFLSTHEKLTVHSSNLLLK